ncbi:hypothetical protein LPB86_09510 [Pedobacter sp. MC2016-14]|uniref:hypothetical protein n=1 Tax=Pedobacter sp. MC2016-14 TaxID=2897327 RepID=UPI001E4595A9|nr:hypothetical protein [Pedobacter sp. MC2016-14]MCD0488467.1 hypothetical protein [Pedobacter sp. MC2016-14]
MFDIKNLLLSLQEDIMQLVENQNTESKPLHNSKDANEIYERLLAFKSIKMNKADKKSFEKVYCLFQLHAFLVQGRQLQN